MSTRKFSGVVAASLALFACSLAGSATAAAPDSWILSGVTPMQATHGQLVTIAGVGLEGTTAVTFGGIAAPSFTVAPNGTSITVAVPPQAPSGSIYVEVSAGDQGGQQRIGPLVIGAGSVPVASIQPRITGLTPLRGRIGTKITVSGQNLGGVSWLKIGGVNASFSMRSGTTLTAIVPKHAHSGRVVLHTAGGTTASAQRFTIMPGRAV